MTEYRLRHVAEINPPTPGFDRLASDQELTFLPMEAIWSGSRLDISQRRQKAAVITGYTRFQNGDVLVPKITPTFEAGRSILAEGLHNGVGAGSTELHVLRPGPNLDARFLLYLVNTHSFLKLGAAAMYGVAGQQRVPDNFLRDLTVRLPPTQEQRRIADFLDAETARIDELASRRNAQLELLSERFSTSILLGITGANERGGRRYSGAAWLGSVPADWAVIPISYQFEVLLGKMLNQERVRGEHLKPYLRNTNVQWDCITTNDLLMMDFPPEEQARYRLSTGDLLVCEGGEPGRAAIWDGEISEIYYQKALHRVRPRSYSSSRWLFYCLRAATAQNVFAVEGNTTTIAHLTREQMNAHRFPFPARDTQDRITSMLDDLSAQHKMAKESLSRQQTLLNERRCTLITAAVTGQIDVSTASGRAIEEELT